MTILQNALIFTTTKQDIYRNDLNLTKKKKKKKKHTVWVTCTILWNSVDRKNHKLKNYQAIPEWA